MRSSFPHYPGRPERGSNYRALVLRPLRRNLLIWGLGGVILPFIGIKLIDLVIVSLHMVS